MPITWLTPKAKRWQRVLTRTRHDIYHRPGYVEACARYDGGTAHALLLEVDGGAILLPFIRRRIPSSGHDEFDATSPYGYSSPLIIYEGNDLTSFLQNALPKVTEALRDAGLVSLFVRSHPLLPLPWSSFEAFGTVVAHGRTVSVDLQQSQQSAWAATRTNHQRQIKACKSEGLRVSHDPELTGLTDFVDAYHTTMRRLNASPFYFFPQTYFQDLRKALGETLHLFHITGEEGLLCAGLFSVQHGIIQYLLSGTTDAGYPHHPLKLMLDSVRKWGQRNDHARFHLGGGVGGEEDSLFHFKAGFGAGRHPFHTWRVILDHERYQTLCPHYSDPQSLASRPDAYFPLYRAPDSKINTLAL